MALAVPACVSQPASCNALRHRDSTWGCPAQAVSPPHPTQGAVTMDTPPGLLQYLGNTGWKGSSGCGGQARACWGVGQGGAWGVWGSAHTSREQTCPLLSAHQESSTPLSQHALPLTPQRIDLILDLQIGNLGSASPGGTTKKWQLV